MPQELRLRSDSETLEYPKKPVDIKSRQTQEFVIGLCGPIGSPINDVAEKLQEILISEYKYECEIIKMSALIIKHSDYKPMENEFERVKTLIRLGDNLRQKYKNEILSEMAIHQISLKRNKEKELDQEESYSSRRRCYIINSIKNEDELVLFREVYGDLFYFIGVFSPIEARCINLHKKGIKTTQIWDLIDQDSGEEISHGQTVRDTFPQADFFLRLGSPLKNEMDAKIRRYLHLIFGTEIITPDPNETAMYLAASAAGNSSCLSRQVGACLTDKQGEILSIGWNDVPQAGGSLVQNSTKRDTRCKNYGDCKCQNDVEKDIIMKSVVTDLVNSDKGILKESQKDDAYSILKTSKIKDLIEFSRAIHAEMQAIISGAQKCGDRMIGGKLFCTTYPCHSCARHIVAAGIMEVYYIEPYRKSLAIKLHDDSITESESDYSKVQILMFDGVAPRRYLELFKSNGIIRKNNGKKLIIDKKEATPLLKVSLDSFPVLENIVLINLKAKKISLEEVTNVA